MTLNVFSLLRRLLFIYQSELYMYPYLLKYAFSAKVFSNPEVRQQLNWTLKAKLLYFISLALFSIVLIAALYQFYYLFSLATFILLSIFGYLFLLIYLPFFLITANVLITPFDFMMKNKIINQAKAKLNSRLEDLTIIAVAGSFGKTSVKELLSEILSTKYSVLSSPGNKNTPLGLAGFMSDLKLSHQFLIVEMGEMYRGDIKEMCEIVNPHYGVISGINMQHFERFESEEAIVETINELSAYLPSSSSLFVNGDSKLAKNSVPNFTKANIKYYSRDNIKTIEHSKPLGTLKLTHKNKQTINSNFLADYFPSLVDLAFKIAEEFQINDAKIIKVLEKMQPAPHRLSPNYYPENDFLLIDDTYNGNLDGALAAMKTLKRYEDKHRIYLTPGLVELGNKTEEVHLKIGENLAECTDEVWLIKNSATDYILRGLDKKKFPTNMIRVFNSAPEAHKNIQSLSKSTVLLMQNDWSDNYF